MSGVRPSAKITGGGGIREAIYRGRVIDAQFEIAEALRPLGERHDLRREGRRLKQHALRGIVRRLGAILQLRLSLLVAWVTFDLPGCGGHVLGTRSRADRK